MTRDELLEEIEILTDSPYFGDGKWTDQKVALLVPDLVVHLKALLKWEELCLGHYASHNPPVVIQPCGCAICEAAKECSVPQPKCIGHPVGDSCFCFGEEREPNNGSA